MLKPFKSSKKNTGGSYNIINGSEKKLSKAASLHQVQDRSTKEIWHAKLYDNDIIKFYAMQDNLEFNTNLLLSAKEMDNVIYVKEIFVKANKTFIIQEQYDKTLKDEVSSGPIDPNTLKEILQDILTGLLEVYGEQYYTKSLRPEHIVNVEDVWKIQSFVYDVNIYGFESEICWSSKFASPEDKAKDGELLESLIDEQIVWNLGILGLYMILGEKFDYSKIEKDSDIPWSEVKNETNEEIYSFLYDSLRVNFRDRLKLKDLLEHEMFLSTATGFGNPFLSYEKFINDESKLLKKKSEIKLKEGELKKFELLKDEFERFKYFGEVEKYVQEVHFKNSFDVNLIRYLSFKIAFENLVRIKKEVGAWKRENEELAHYYPLQKVEEKITVYLKNVRKNKENYSKNLLKKEMLKSEIAEIRNGLDDEINDNNLPFSQVSHLYLKVSGSIYSALSQDHLIKDNENKQRTVCYYSLGAYLLHFYDTSKFIIKDIRDFQEDGTLILEKFINQGPLPELILLSQNLIKENFATNDYK